VTEYPQVYRKRPDDTICRQWRESTTFRQHSRLHGPFAARIHRACRMAQRGDRGLFDNARSHARKPAAKLPPGSRQAKDRYVVTMTVNARRNTRKLIVRGLMIGTMAVLVASCGKKDRPKADLAASQVTTIGVNAYLWRASLDALSFMPLLQTDSNGGVIVTDWYANPKNPGERVKVTVSIVDQDLRADALRVAASRQVSQNGQWVDAPVQAATVQKLEDIILTKARDLRRAAIAG
jgi:hypothetical protein